MFNALFITLKQVAKPNTGHFIKYIASIILLVSISGCINLYQHTITNDEFGVTDLQTTFSYNDNRYRVTATLSGPVSLSADGNRIVSLSPNSFITMKNLSNKTVVSIKNNTNNPQNSSTLTLVEVNGKSIPLAQADAKIQEASFALLRNTGVAAKERVMAICTSRSEKAVLDEIDLLSGDYTKSLYIKEFVTVLSANEGVGLDCAGESLDSTLSSGVWERVIKQTKTISSDNEFSAVLKYTVDVMPHTKTLRASLLESSMHVNSDFEKSTLLQHLIDVQFLPIDQLLPVAKDISSDFELGRVLKRSIPQLEADSDFTAFFRAASSVGSDFELAEVLLSFDYATLDNIAIGQLLSAAKDISSDYELARVLKRSSSMLATEGDFAAFFRTASSVGSDFELTEVLLSFDYATLDNIAIEQIISFASANIHNDYELSRLLITIIDKVPNTDSIEAALNEASKSISSDHQKLQVLEALHIR